MKIGETGRIYTAKLDQWSAFGEDGKEYLTQVEYAYTEYDEDGNVVGAGSEDIQPRYQIETKYFNQPMILRGKNGNSVYWIWTWDGQKRHKSGARKFICHGMMNIRGSKKAVRNALKKKYGCAEVQFR